MSHLLRRIFIAPIRLYQRTISPWLGPHCRFRPTCSNYAIEAIRRHGVLKGLALGTWRILRCHPFSKGGYDPVPQRRSKVEARSSHVEDDGTELRSDECEMQKDDAGHPGYNGVKSEESTGKERGAPEGG